MSVTFNHLLSSGAETRRLAVDDILSALTDYTNAKVQNAEMVQEEDSAHCSKFSAESLLLSAAYIFEYHSWETEAREIIERENTTITLSQKGKRPDGSYESDLEHLLRNFTELNLTYEGNFLEIMNEARQRVVNAKHKIEHSQPEDARYATKKDYHKLNDAIVNFWKGVSSRLTSNA